MYFTIFRVDSSCLLRKLSLSEVMVLNSMSKTETNSTTLVPEVKQCIDIGCIISDLRLKNVERAQRSYSNESDCNSKDRKHASVFFQILPDEQFNSRWQESAIWSSVISS